MSNKETRRIYKGFVEREDATVGEFFAWSPHKSHNYLAVYVDRDTRLAVWDGGHGQILRWVDGEQKKDEYVSIPWLSDWTLQEQLENWIEEWDDNEEWEVIK